MERDLVAGAGDLSGGNEDEEARKVKKMRK
jgi:hypothetical protein